MPLLIAQQRSPEWYAARKGRIGASIAAACLGLCPYTSRQKAWRMVMGTEPDRDNRHKDWGRQFEPEARADYECVTGNLVEETGLWVSEALPFIVASPDGMVGTDGALEIKCGSKLPGAVPVPHRVQCLVQLYCTGRMWVDYFAYLPGNGHYLTRVHRCEGIDGLVKRLASFYHRYIATGLEPERKKRKRKEG